MPRHVACLSFDVLVTSAVIGVRSLGNVKRLELALAECTTQALAMICCLLTIVTRGRFFRFHDLPLVRRGWGPSPLMSMCLKSVLTFPDLIQVVIAMTRRLNHCAISKTTASMIVPQSYSYV